VTTVRISAERYTSTAYSEREARELWPRVWQLACPIDQVANPGDYYEYRCGRISVLVVRGDDGVLRAFQNACRHRGSAICEGSGTGLTELRCPFHRWTWSLHGELREIPSRKVFGITNSELPLIPVAVDVWGPLVFVNCDTDAMPLAEFLSPLPNETEWAALDGFRCTAMVSVAARCNWKTLIDGFSETYHVQGIHPEMLGMADDVNGPQHVWEHAGRLVQSYGLPSPRLGSNVDVDDQYVWEHFVTVMGARIGADMTAPGPCPALREGETLRDLLARMVVEQQARRGVDLSHYSTAQLLDMEQYNIFPNITVLVFADMMQVVRARPGAAVTDAFMDAMSFERHASNDSSPRSKPRFDLELDGNDELPLGLVLNQDLANFARSQKGLHQPGFTELVVSESEECRIVNLHRNLDRWLTPQP
jgi:choline monooxygenase